MTSLFLGNNMQHQPVCAKTISSWVRKVLYVGKAHVSGLSLGVAASAGLAAGVPLVTILLGTISPPTLLLWIGTRTPCSMQCWASLSRSSPSKCHTLTYNQY